MKHLQLRCGQKEALFNGGMEGNLKDENYFKNFPEELMFRTKAFFSLYFCTIKLFCFFFWRYRVINIFLC